MARARYHHGDLRRALIEAGRELLEKEGVEGVTVRGAARLAGVAHSAPAHHFADKAALLAAIAEEGFRTLADAMRAARDGEKKPADRLLATGRAYVRFALAEPARFELMFGRDLDDARFATLVEAARACFGVLEEAVRALPPSERKALDPRVIALSAWGLVHGLATLRNDGALGGFLAEDADVEALATAASAAFVRGLKRKARPRRPSKSSERVERATTRR
ncbi:MAG: TetR/AcrR family transcriptional regulator [Polyangiales bacterium]